MYQITSATLDNIKQLAGSRWVPYETDVLV